MPQTPGVAQSATQTSDTLVRTGHTKLHWVTVNNSHATATSAIELSNSDDGASNDLWTIVLGDVDGATSSLHCTFDPPIEFSTHLYVDITGGTAVVTVGYS